MEGDPFTLIEGMTIAAYAVGATEGYVYIRSRVPRRRRDAARRDRRSPTRTAGSAQDVLGSGLGFDLHVRVGAGAYICGEETSMLESLEGKRGVVRAKPPIPALEGLFGKPTVVNNVLTLARCRRSWPTAPRPTPRSASAARAAPRSSSSPATSPAAASSSRRSASRWASWSTDYGGGTRQRPAGPGGAGRRPARRLPAGDQLRPADGLRGVRRGRRDGRPRRHRGVRRHRRHGRAGPVRDGVLRRGVVRQVHAVPRRVDPRRRGDRPDHRRRRTRGRTSCCSRTCAR